MQNTNLDFAAWVDGTGAEGHPGVHIWGFIPPRQKLDGSVVESRWGYVYPGITPWPRRTSGDNAADGGKQWDLKSFDEGTDPNGQYWPRLRALCGQLKDQGRVLGITVFFGWPKDTADFAYHPFASGNGGPALSRGDITHIEQPGTEIHTQTYDTGWPIRRKTQWIWERYALKLIETAESCGNIWFDFRDEWSYDLDTNMETHFRNFFMSRDQVWADRSSSASFRVNNGLTDATFGATPAMKTEGDPYDHNGVRVEVWTRGMGGLHYLLHNDSREPGIMAWDPKTAEKKGLDPETDLGRKYVGYAGRFFNTHVHSLDSMLPNDNLCSGNSHCTATVGLEYAVYVPAGQASVDVNLTPVVGDVEVRFYDPRAGTFGAASAATGGATRTFTTPAAAKDWVLHLVATKDTDSDGLADVDEKAHLTNPAIADTDGDGYCDGDEVNTYDTNPLDKNDFPVPPDSTGPDGGPTGDSDTSETGDNGATDDDSPPGTNGLDNGWEGTGCAALPAGGSGRGSDIGLWAAIHGFVFGLARRRYRQRAQ
jgi:hypothetical protein